MDDTQYARAVDAAFAKCHFEQYAIRQKYEARLAALHATRRARALRLVVLVSGVAALLSLLSLA